jgi:hypothetical protein
MTQDQHPMKIARYASILALVGTIVPPILFMFHVLQLQPLKVVMFMSTILWFASAPLWMKTD